MTLCNHFWYPKG